MVNPCCAEFDSSSKVYTETKLLLSECLQKIQIVAKIHAIKRHTKGSPTWRAHHIDWSDRQWQNDILERVLIGFGYSRAENVVGQLRNTESSPCQNDDDTILGVIMAS